MADGEGSRVVIVVPTRATGHRELTTWAWIASSFMPGMITHLRREKEVSFAASNYDAAATHFVAGDVEARHSTGAALTASQDDVVVATKLATAPIVG